MIGTKKNDRGIDKAFYAKTMRLYCFALMKFFRILVKDIVFYLPTNYNIYRRPTL